MEANEFILRDEGGRVRALLGISEGEPLLELYDSNGCPRAAIAEAKGGAVLTLHDESGTEHLGLHVALDLTGSTRPVPSLTLRDANADVRASLYLLSDEPHFCLCDAKATAYISVAVTAFGSWIGLSEQNGRAVNITTMTDGSNVSISDADGNKTVIGTEGLASKVKDVLNKTPGKASAAFISLYGKNEELLWSAP